METVMTSEALEAQILEDARARAKRLRDSAEKECEATRADAERRDAEEANRLDAACAQKIAELRKDLDGSLPLDFTRLRLLFFQKATSLALEEFFAALGDAELERVIGGQVAKASFAFIDRKLAIRFAGITEKQARRIVTSNVSGAVVENAVPMQADQAAEAIKGLVVETADGSRRLRATLRELTALLFDENREELLTALFGKDMKK